MNPGCMCQVISRSRPRNLFSIQFSWVLNEFRARDVYRNLICSRLLQSACIARNMSDNFCNNFYRSKINLSLWFYDALHDCSKVGNFFSNIGEKFFVKKNLTGIMIVEVLYRLQEPNWLKIFWNLLNLTL